MQIANEPRDAASAAFWLDTEPVILPVAARQSALAKLRDVTSPAAPYCAEGGLISNLVAIMVTAPSRPRMRIFAGNHCFSTASHT